MKKIIALILAVAMLATMAIVFTSCSKGEMTYKIGVQTATTAQYFVDGDADWGFDGIAGFTTAIKVSSTDIQYTDVTLTATVDGDNLKTLEITYGFSAKMALKAGLTINGSGKATNKMTYTIG